MAANRHADAVHAYLEYLCQSPKPTEATPWVDWRKVALGASAMAGLALGTGACFGGDVIGGTVPVYGIGGGLPGGAGVGGRAQGGSGVGGHAGTAAGTGGTGGTDCGCTNGSYAPVCGADGTTHDATCGAACVPVDIACVGACPCDPTGASCDIGCTAVTSSTYCDAARVEWVCNGSHRASLLAGVGCEMLPTGAIRYCCPGGFLKACR